ncbi:PREDICTED: uncharacterized protein LOC109236866 [Nicotiana attenuata]|uniref:uncharacterized protein LOC109236866 n=1 Tax=Nicotiana attenuata TaxID=49451 RepID=UPI0009059FD9|nr:PREDICTED: uncharacterized protein LOC109236866 [Nicotiana attenuata]
MADKFVTAHAGAKKAEARVNDIFVVRQMHDEGLRDFLARFNRVRMSLLNVSEGMAVAAFQNGLNRNGSRATRKLLSRLMKYPPTTWEEIHNAYCTEVRANEEELNGPTQRLTSLQTEARKYRRNDDRRDQLGPRLGRERHQHYVRTSPPPPPWHTDAPPRYTAPYRHEKGMPPLLSAHNFRIYPSEIVYALEKLGPKVQWPQKMRSDPSTRKSSAFYRFHQERGHKTKDCIGLRQDIVRMLSQGHLKELLSDRGRDNFARGREQPQGPPKPPYPAHTVQMIIGGGDGATINHVKFTTTHKLKRSITHERY